MTRTLPVLLLVTGGLVSASSGLQAQEQDPSSAPPANRSGMGRPMGQMGPMDNMGCMDMRAMRDMMDADKDGKVTRDEFMQHHESMFTMMDKDANGALDDAEMRTGMQEHMKMKAPR